MAHPAGLSHSQGWQALETWHTHLPALVADLETPAFPPRVDAALQALAPFDQSCIFLYPAGGSPALLHDNLHGIPEPGAMQRYVNGTYLLDPVYTACAHGRPAGLYRMRELAPDAFFEGEYFNSPDVHPCISLASGSLAEEIVFLSPLPGGTYAAYSLMRCNGSPVFAGRRSPPCACASRRWRPSCSAITPGWRWHRWARGRRAASPSTWPRPSPASPPTVSPHASRP
ncbi:hypothetical protein [Pseudomonas sp. Pc102]|uniref:hypothetical protein n=1 Tax=Pseudomonas sp. Pc102 TaxID=2678261 RepID=UPI001FD46AB0|nr:hypothetical protein [Pseudomonas sp. Pc102]